MKIGIDIVLVSRIENIQKRFNEKSLRRFLDKKEIKLTAKAQTMAGFWAAKEAFVKALGTGFGKECGLLDIKVRKDKRNAPYIKVSKKVKKKFNIKKTALSISHDGGFVIAVVVLN